MVPKMLVVAGDLQQVAGLCLHDEGGISSGDERQHLTIESNTRETTKN